MEQIMTTALKNQSFSGNLISDGNGQLHVELEQRIRERISDCPYSFYFNKIEWSFENGRLTLYGQVPSYYMKQVLQTLLRGIEEVEQINNEVDVVSVTGLSSVRSR
jgi:osmotically-inducible protein OsmY